MTVRTGACSPWATRDDVDKCAPCVSSADVDETLYDEMLEIATDVLFQLSGRQFAGVCETVVRPCCNRQDWSYGRFTENYGTRGYGAFYGSFYGWNGFGRGPCGDCNEITLGASPIRTITQVKINGDVFAPANYRVMDDYLLRRIDGQAWPCCQDLNKDDTEDDTFSVAFTYGIDPPKPGIRASAALACELVQSCIGGECNLPKRVTSITRQGVSMTILDPFDFLDNGRTGIYEVDLFLNAYNPDRLRRRPTVSSPSITKPVRRRDETPGS